MQHLRRVLLLLAVFLLATAGFGFAQASFPVPREQSVVVETDQTYQYFNTANPVKPYGTQWGSGWHQIAQEWDWYMDYATGQRRLWRTTGWEYNKDYTQLTWHVRKGVTWNDGVPYTAQDIVFTFNLFMKNPDLGGAGAASNVASVTAPDDYTVIFKFKQADPRWHQNHEDVGPVRSGRHSGQARLREPGSAYLQQLAARGDRALQAEGLVPGPRNVRVGAGSQLLGNQGHEQDPGSSVRHLPKRSSSGPGPAGVREGQRG